MSRRRALRTLALGAVGLWAGCVPGRTTAKGRGDAPASHRDDPRVAIDPSPALRPLASSTVAAELARRAYGPGALQFGDLRLPAAKGPHPVVLVVHGGFWLSTFDLGLMNALCDAFAAAGLATWNIEYRRLGDDGGGFPGTFLDVAAAADFVRTLAVEFPLDLGRVVSLGHSAGGHLALWLAARRRISAGELRPTRPPLALRGAVALAGVADLRLASAMGFAVVDRLMGGSPERVPARYQAGSPAELVPLHLRQILIHGRDDRVVPIEISAHYRAAAIASGDDADLIALDDIGHFELIDPTSRAWPIVERATRSLL